MKCFLQISIGLMLVVSTCKNPPRADKVEADQPKKAEVIADSSNHYKLNLQKSNVQWTAATRFRRQHGTFLFKEGSFIINDTVLEGGHFIVNTKTLTAFDEDGSPNSKLQNHLKSADFFDVEKYETAGFVITSVQPAMKNDRDLVMKDATHIITGNLKIKDSTRSISVPPRVTISGGRLVADASFNIDRTQWGMTYGNKKTRLIKYIKPEINLVVHVEANR